MTQHGRNHKGGKGGSGGGGTPSPDPRRVTVSIGQPFTIRQESTSEDNQQYAEEKAHRSASLRFAKNLNRITVGGILVTLLSVGAIYLTLRQTDRSARIDQRAWLGIKGVNPAIIQGAFGAMAQFQNTGKTPAINVSFHQRIDEVGEPIPGVEDPQGIFNPQTFLRDDYTYFSWTEDERFGQVAPNATPNIGYGQTNTTGIIPISQTAKVFAYFHGRMTYDDVFGHKHWYVFCFKIRKRPTPDTEGGWQPCATNNQIDVDME